MKSCLTQDEIDRFRDLVASIFGLQFDSDKDDMLSDIVQGRLAARGGANPSAYLSSLGAGDREELRALASLLTVTETYFFRCSEQFQALTEIALPARICAHAKDRRLRLLSAGCASGEEPYSLAIHLRERFPEIAAWNIRILGFDLNPAMIAKASRGWFHEWSLRNTSREIRERFFRCEDKDFMLDKAIRSMVSFEERDLVSLENAGGPFDIIMCRNVIMYLTPAATRSAVAGLTRLLAPGGFLFLGGAETLRGLSCDFHLHHTQDAFYYEKKTTAENEETDSGWMPQAISPVLGTGGEPGWMDAVERALEPIESLKRDATLPVLPTPPPRKPLVESTNAARHGRGFALELLRQERFQEALNILSGLAPQDGSDLDTQLLRAGLLVNCGDLASAEGICSEILSKDDLNAGAHYLTAVCREHAGDIFGAMEHDRSAIYLDNNFAMPHLHLGRLAKRAADLGTTRRELEQAGRLLLAEDPSRILLFGGGFHRDTLVAMTRAELRNCGGGREA